MTALAGGNRGKFSDGKLAFSFTDGGLGGEEGDRRGEGGGAGTGVCTPARGIEQPAYSGCLCAPSDDDGLMPRL